ncbi:MAG TPA: hypothetical protein VNT51_09800 [Miltoncostaeaceae bacterium]|nr:hypothetical protein [Miltoncostaeaceae bacterium]
MLTAPGRIATRSLTRARCLRTTRMATGGARVAVSLLTGTARRGALVVQSRVSGAAGARRTVRLPLGPRARGLPAGTPLTVALGVRAGTRRTWPRGRSP